MLMMTPREAVISIGLASNSQSWFIILSMAKQINTPVIIQIVKTDNRAPITSEINYVLITITSEINDVDYNLDSSQQLSYRVSGKSANVLITNLHFVQCTSYTAHSVHCTMYTMNITYQLCAIQMSFCLRQDVLLSIQQSRKWHNQ